jgi:hypothetical protein
MLERMSERMSERYVRWTSQICTGGMREDMPDRMLEDLRDRMPEDMPNRMPEDMPEDLPDRMPEDLRVTKCINVMVGITRSKVICFLIVFQP